MSTLNKLVGILCLCYPICLNAADDTICVIGSMFPTWFDGKYQFKGNNTYGSVYYKEQTNRSLFPWIEGNGYAQYLIGDDPNVHVANAWSTMGIPPSSYTFNPEDFMANWQSWAYDDSQGHHIINDTNMRVVRCDSVCIQFGSYQEQFEWMNYNLSTDTSVYHNSNHSYLYRSDINANNEEWKLLHNGTFTPLSLNSITSPPCSAFINGLLFLSYLPLGT